jgi:hypothetical protein
MPTEQDRHGLINRQSGDCSAPGQWYDPFGASSIAPIASLLLAPSGATVQTGLFVPGSAAVPGCQVPRFNLWRPFHTGLFWKVCNMLTFKGS